MNERPLPKGLPAFVLAFSLLAAGAGASLAGVKGVGGLGGKGKQNQDQGPLGLPSLKHLAEALQLTNPQENQVLVWYDDAKKKQHENEQFSKNKNNAGAQPPNDLDKARKDLIDAIRGILTEDQKKKFDELLSDGGKKKKKT